MTLTFKSSRPPVERVVIERHRDGSQRVCRAVQNDHNGRMWSVTLEHPSGDRWSATAYGDASEASIWATKLLADHQHDFERDAGVGHKHSGARSATLRDPNIRVTDTGEDTVSVVSNYMRK